MQFLLTQLTTAFLPIEWFFFLGIPVLLILITIIYFMLGFRQLKQLQEPLERFKDDLKNLDGYSAANIEKLNQLAENCDYEPLSNGLRNLTSAGESKYENKWLPPLREELNAQTLARPQLRSLLSYTPALLILTCGVISSLVLWLLPQINPAQFNEIGLGVKLVPAIIGLINALFLVNQKIKFVQMTAYEIHDLNRTITRHVPVFDDHSGVAMLVNRMLDHENKIERSFVAFNQTAKYLADSEFSAGITEAVRRVMEDEIAPSIRQSSDALIRLSEHLGQQQAEGMRELAEHFAHTVSSTLAEHLNPIKRELEQFNLLMDDTRNFIHDSVAILENSRQQNIVLNRDLSESLKLMTVAKNDLADEMAAISDCLEVMTNTTEKMTTLYAGEEVSLADKINTLSASMSDSLHTLRDSLNRSADTVQLTNTLKSEQADQQEKLQLQMRELVAQMASVEQSLMRSSSNFTAESSQFVDETLSRFDHGLAEVVERLIFTASAIRDAVDALPVALRPGITEPNK